MVYSNTRHLPLGLLLSSLAAASPTAKQGFLRKRESFNVAGGANFPDPSIINVGGVSHVFGTVDGAGNNIPMTSNGDFNNAGGWSAISDAFPVANVPAFGSGGWAAPFSSWAPDVNQLTDFDNSFAMYYSPALQSNGGIHCIGLARSLSVTGPYNDSSTAPLICPESDGGAIDPSGFLDVDNSRYIVYKIDGPAVNNGGFCNSPSNPPSLNTGLMLQQVANNGYDLIGDPVQLYNNQGESDAFNVEAPALVRGPDGTYFLFFSSGCTSDNSYTTSYVTSTSGVRGPYGDRQTLLQTGDFGTFAPGGADIDVASGDFVFHSLLVSDNIGQGRMLDTAHITLNGQSATLS